MYVAHGYQMIPLTRWSYALHAFNGMTTGDVYGTAVPYSTALTSQKKDLFGEKCTLVKKKLFYRQKCGILRAQFPFFDSPNATFLGVKPRGSDDVVSGT